MTCQLSVNLNKVALLRNQRDLTYPSVVQAAHTVIEAGAAGITVHPRPDERHITKNDAHELAGFLRAFPEIEYNIEGNPFESDWLELVKTLKPHQATLVPDDPNQSTSDHGWAASDIFRLQPVVNALQDLGIRVSLFMDADVEPIRAIIASGCDRIELYTEPYAAAVDSRDDQQIALQLERFHVAGQTAHKAGIALNAGHDLTAANLPGLINTLPMLKEVSIGHAFIADALWLGLADTTQRYLQALKHPDAIA